MVWRIRAKIIRTVRCCAVLCTAVVLNMRTHIMFLKSSVFFWFRLDYFVLVLFAFVVLDVVSSVLRQVGWEERLRNDIFCVEWDVKH